MNEVFNINELIYQINQGTKNTEESTTGSYKEVLDKIRHIISINHSAELIDVLYSPKAGEKLKNLIVRYLNQSRFAVAGFDNISTLADRIYEDMASFGILTKYFKDETV